MSNSVTLETLEFHGTIDRSDRRRQFAAESASAPWAKHLRPGDRIDISGSGRETVAVVVEEVCVHPGGYAGLDKCLKHPMRDYRIDDSRLFEVLAAAFVALQVESEEIRSANPPEMTVVVYTIVRRTSAVQLPPLEGRNNTPLAVQQLK